MEPTLAEHIETMVAVFREVRRVLRKDGTVWLNYGDCYSTHPAGKVADPFKTSTLAGTNTAEHANASSRCRGDYFRVKEIPEKNLLMVPNRLAIALQDDGWWVRSEIVWAKPNPMPESVSDRPTSSHEKIWLLTKSARYFYDADAVRTESKWDLTASKMPDGWDTGPGGHGSFHRNGREKGKRSDKQRGHSRRHDGFNDRWDAMPKAEQQAMGANLRNVWNIATKPFSEAHFATFPPELAERCIKAGCPKDGTVLDPFAGSGTTGLAADRQGRDCILVELNPAYAEMARKRIEADSGMFSEVTVDTYNPTADALGSYHDAIAEIRRRKLLSGEYEPVTEEERRMVEGAQK